jgi:hypothetical protein
MNVEVLMPGRQKTSGEQEEDKVRLKQLALLWWAQKIYEGAHKQCVQTDAYRYHHGQTANSVDYNLAYMDVLRKLRTLAIELNGDPAGEKLWADVKRSPQLPQAFSTSGGCTSDADCADYYVCIGGECEPIVPDADFT